MNRNSHLQFGISFSMVAMIMLMAVMLSSCAGIPGYGTGPMKTTRITVDPATGAETTIIEEPTAQPTAGGFFKSENLAEHYAFEKGRTDSHAAAVDKKTSAIVSNTAYMMQLKGTTDTEKLLAGVIANMQIDRIQTSPGPSGIKEPKTMVDVVDRNLSSFVMLGLGIWDRVDDRDKRGDDSQVTVTNTGDGNVFYQSDRNSLSQQTSKYTLGDSSGDLGLPGSTFMPTVNNTDSNDTNNTRTDSANSETSTLW